MSTPRFFTAAALVGILLLNPAFVFAADKPGSVTGYPKEVFIPTESDVPPNPTGSPELTSCFDFYRFGSTPITVRGDVSTVSQGGAITFTGAITNENEYPILNLGIYAKVLHKWTDEKTSFGPDVVDWFPVQEGIVLKAGEKKPIAFTWKVPQNAPAGTYKIALFAVSDQRFNLAGLTFTNDIVGGSYDFKVVGDNKGYTMFDNKNIDIAGQIFRSAAFAPQIDVSDGIPVKALVVNTSKKPFNGTVTWKTYLWDGLREETVIDEKSEPVSIPGMASTTLSYEFKDAAHTVYYAIGTLTSNDPDDMKSLITLRAVSANNAEPRINYVGVTKYPAQGATLFACVHSSGRKEAENVSFVVRAEALNPILRWLPGGTYAEKSYNGTVQGALSALAVPLDVAPGSFLLTASVFQNGKKIDEVAIPYKCDVLGGKCGDDTLATIMVGLGALILIIALLLVIRLLRRPKAESN